jgi:hypothetical protein
MLIYFAFSGLGSNVVFFYEALKGVIFPFLIALTASSNVVFFYEALKG